MGLSRDCLALMGVLLGSITYVKEAPVVEKVMGSPPTPSVLIPPRADPGGPEVRAQTTASPGEVTHCGTRHAERKANKCHPGKGRRMFSGWQTPGSPPPCGGKRWGLRWLQCFPHHKDMQTHAEGKDARSLPQPRALQRGIKCPQDFLSPNAKAQTGKLCYIILLWTYFMAAAAAEKVPEHWVYCSKDLLLAPGFTLLPASVQWVKNGEPACSRVCLVCSLAPGPCLEWCWESAPHDGWTEVIVGVRKVCPAQLSTSPQQMLYKQGSSWL